MLVLCVEKVVLCPSGVLSAVLQNLSLNCKYDVIHIRTEHTAERNTPKHHAKCHILIDPYFNN